MKLAINYSPQAEMLASRQTIELDLFKFPPASDKVVMAHAPDLLVRASACRPIYIHFPLHTGNGSIEITDWTEVKEALSQTSTPYVNVHLQAQIENFSDMQTDTHAPKDIVRLTDILIKDVASVAEKFGPERVMVENVVYRGPDGKILYPCVDPVVISQVVTETKCGLLLDTAHARLTCLALGIDVKGYIAGLPVSHLKELHVTGAQFDSQRLRDSMAMGHEDWELAEWVMRQISEERWAKPWALAFEYGGVGPGFAWRSEADVIAEQLPRLRELTAAT